MLRAVLLAVIALVPDPGPHLASRQLCGPDLACREEVRIHHLRLGRPDLRAARALLAPLCGTDGSACYHLGLVERAARRPADALAAFARGCDLGDAESCVAYVDGSRDVRAMRRAGLSLDAAGATARLDRSCTDGAAAACERLARRDADVDARAAHTALACDLGARAACATLAQAFDRGGELADAPYFERRGSGRDPVRAASYAEEACALGLAQACVDAARLRLEPAVADPCGAERVLVRACRRPGDRTCRARDEAHAACAALSAMPEPVIVDE